MTYYPRERRMSDLPRLILSEGCSIAAGLMAPDYATRKAAIDRLWTYVASEHDRLVNGSWVACQPTYNALLSIYRHEAELLARDLVWSQEAA